MTTDIVLIIYGFFLILGGFLGFKKGSKISLIMGLVSGLLVFVGLWLLTFTPKVAWIFLTCLNVLLSLVFMFRFVKNLRQPKQLGLLPSGMLLLIALAVLIFCLTKII